MPDDTSTNPPTPHNPAPTPPPDRKTPPTSTAESLVGTCAVTNCVYNRGYMCAAGVVSIVLLAGVPRCATYSPVEEHSAPEKP